MNQEEINSIKIQRYLDEDMSEAERLEFEKELQHDPALESLVATYRTLSEGIRYHGRQNAWEKIQQLEEAHATETIEINSSSRRLWPLYAVAASIAIFALSIFYLLNFQINKGERLFEEHFTPYQALAYAPTRSEDTPESLQERAFSAYSNENYQQAVSLLEEIDASEDDPMIWFYLGNAYLAIEKPEQAIVYFQQVLNQQNALVPQAQWYLGLSYLAKGDKIQAKAVFGALANNTSSYSLKAQTILNQL